MINNEYSKSELFEKSYYSHLNRLKDESNQLLENTKAKYIIIFSGIHHYPYMDDNSYPFKANPYFIRWLPLLRHPNCYIIHELDKKPKLIYFQEKNFWHKTVEDPNSYWVKFFEIKIVHELDKITSLLPLNKKECILITNNQNNDQHSHEIKNINPANVINSLNYSRTIKSEYEIECLRAASRRAVKGHRCAEKKFKEGDHYSGAPALLSQFVDSPIINAGDGSHEHPSQALLDLLTIRSQKGDLEGLKVAIVGDISHSRVARSNIQAMQTMGIKVRVVGPPTLIPAEFERLGVDVSYNLREAIKDVDVVMVLRVQLERQKQGFLSSLREYSNYFCLTSESLANARDDILIIHPGPVNRGVEISLDVMESHRSLILNQVTNGVAIRMALFYLILGENNANPN